MLTGLLLAQVLSSPLRLQSICAAQTSGPSFTVTLPRPTTPGSLVVGAVTYGTAGRTLRALRLVDEANVEFVELADNADGGGSHDNRVFMSRGSGTQRVRVELNRPVDSRSIVSLFLAEYAAGTQRRSGNKRRDDTDIVIGPVTLSEREFVVASAVVEMGAVQSMGLQDGGFRVVETCSGDALVELLDAGAGTFESHLQAGIAGWNAVWVVFEDAPPGLDGGALVDGGFGTDGGLVARQLTVSSCEVTFLGPLVAVAALVVASRFRRATAAARAAARTNLSARRGLG